MHQQHHHRLFPDLTLGLFDELLGRERGIAVPVGGVPVIIGILLLLGFFGQLAHDALRIALRDRIARSARKAQDRRA